MNCNHSTYDKMKSIKEMPYVPEYSDDPIYWELVKEGIDIVPEFIDHLDDTTNTKMYVPLFSGIYRIGDISYLLLTEIINDIPTFELLNISLEKYEQYGFGVYWNFIKSNSANRKILKTKINDWSSANKNKLTWEMDERKFRGDTHNFPRKHPAGGYYILKK